MVIQDPEPKEVPLIIYDFTLRTGTANHVSLRSDLGDTVTEDAAGWLFHFPRLHETVRVYRDAVAILQHRESTIKVLPPSDPRKPHDAKS